MEEGLFMLISANTAKTELELQDNMTEKQLKYKYTLYD